MLHLERPHWETRVWLDGKLLGSNDSLSTPHEYDLGTALEPGKHRLTIRVDNRLVVDVGAQLPQRHRPHAGQLERHRGRHRAAAGEPGVDRRRAGLSERGGAVGASCAGGSATRRARPAAGPFESASRCPVSAGRRAARRKGRDRVRVEGVRRGVGRGGRRVRGRGGPRRASAPLWDEFTPVLLQLDATLECGRGTATSRSRSPSACARSARRARSSSINGRKTFFRGTLECCIFPLTGHPPTDVESWKRIIRIAKAHGLNLIRFHSWCPPEAAFVAADELGFYYQVEIASLGQQSTSLGDGKPVDEWLYRRDRPHPQGLRQPSLVRAHALRQRARRADDAGSYLGRVGGPLEGARPAPALHERLGLAADPGEPVPRHARPAHPGLGRGARIAHQRPAAGDAHRLPRLRRSANGAGHQPRDRPVVRLSELRRDARNTRATSSRRTSRSSATRWPRIGMGDQARDFLHGLGQAADALLQGGHRVGAAHAGHGRLRAARPARLPRPGHRAGRRARPVLGLEGLRHGRRITAASAGRPCRWPGSSERVFTTDETLAGGHRGRPLRGEAARRGDARLEPRRRRRAGRGSGLAARRGTCRSTTGSPWAA